MDNIRLAPRALSDLAAIPEGPCRDLVLAALAALTTKSPAVELPGRKGFFVVRVEEDISSLDWVDDDDDEAGCVHFVKFRKLDDGERSDYGVRARPAYVVFRIEPLPAIG